MSHFKRCFCLPVLLLALLSAAACSNTNGGAPTATASGAGPLAIQMNNLPKNSTGIPLVARVNDTEITLPQFETMFQRYQAQPYGGDPNNMPKLVLQTMIQQVLIDQAAAKNNVVVTDQEVDTELQALIKSSGGTVAWQQWLKDNNFSEDQLRATLHDTLLTSRMRDRVTGDLTGNVAQVHARHILVATEDEANQLLVRLKNGQDFAALATQVSLDTSTSPNGGDLGWFTQDELLEPAISQVAFQLQPGQIAGPIKTSMGYDIIQTLERANRPIDPDKRAQVAQNRFENWLNTLTATAKIEQYL